MVLHCGTFRFSLRATSEILIPAYKGSTFRGGFGNAFRRVVCALKRSDCNECILKDRCVYSYIFETPPPPGTKVMTKYTHAPHPFVIEPPMERKRLYQPGDELKFDLVLVGKALEYLSYFVYSFSELGKIGIGKGHGKYDLITVSRLRGNGGEINEELIYSSETKAIKKFDPDALNIDVDLDNSAASKEGTITLSFLTPTRLMYDSRLVFDIEFHMLIRQLLRRIFLLGYFHCGADSSGLPYNAIIDKAAGIRLRERKLRWYDWERYSTRQDTMMKMGGFVGEVTFEGDVAPFFPLLQAGEVLHVGKGTSFGLGKYLIKEKCF